MSLVQDPVFRAVQMVTPGNRTVAGHLGVLAHHAALVTALAQGTLTVQVAGGQTERYEVSGGSSR